MAITFNNMSADSGGIVKETEPKPGPGAKIPATYVDDSGNRRTGVTSYSDPYWDSIPSQPIYFCLFAPTNH